MGITDYIVAIELGSTQLRCMAARKSHEGILELSAYAETDATDFVRKGVIFNLDKATKKLKTVITEVEEKIGCRIQKAYVSAEGQSMRTMKNIITRKLGKEEIITEEIINSIGDENIGIPVLDMDVLDVAPQEYKVGYNRQANPIGLVGDQIEGRFLNIVARSTMRKNIDYCFRQAELDTADLLIGPVVAADAVLSDTEKRAGVAFIDFGADTTTVSIFQSGLLRFLSVIPLGGASITADLTDLKIEEEEAEQLKKSHGDVLYEEKKQEEPATCNVGENGRLMELSQINDIIAARQEEILANVRHQLQLSGYEDKLLAGIVIIGGATNMKNLIPLISKMLHIDKVRFATQVKEQIKDTDNLLKTDGTQITLLGLLLKGNEVCTKPGMANNPAENRNVGVETDIFDNDEDLRRQEEEAKKKQKEKEEEERKKHSDNESKKNKGKGNWWRRFSDTLTREIFSEDEM